jgi:hypothetical protein
MASRSRHFPENAALPDGTSKKLVATTGSDTDVSTLRRSGSNVSQGDSNTA